MYKVFAPLTLILQENVSYFVHHKQIGPVSRKILSLDRNVSTLMPLVSIVFSTLKISFRLKIFLEISPMIADYPDKSIPRNPWRQSLDMVMSDVGRVSSRKCIQNLTSHPGDGFSENSLKHINWT